MKKVDIKTADEAIEAHMGRFGFIPWGLSTMADEYIVAAVEKALKTGEPCKCEAPPRDASCRARLLGRWEAI